MGYVTASLIIFALLASFFLIPRQFPEPDLTGCQLGEAPESEQTQILPAINYSLGGIDNTHNDEYVLIRVKVPLRPDTLGASFTATILESEHFIKYDNLIDGKQVYYPGAFGEIDMLRNVVTDYDTTDNRSLSERRYKDLPQNQLRFKPEGIILFVYLDNSGKPIEKNGIWTMDFYQSKDRLRRPNKGYTLPELFACPKGQYSTSTVLVPVQEKSKTQDQLQLEYIKFQAFGYLSSHCKPAVYLYPEKKSLVNVKVNPKGILGFTDPVYDPASGWTVEAFPDGRLYDFSHSASITHNYLYYESKIHDTAITKPEKGWVVRTEELPNLYAQILPKLGLNKKEQTDFTDYWNKALPFSPYYFVGIIDKSQRDYIEPLDVTPTPQTSIRFSLFFEALDTPRLVENPVLGNAPERNGFTLVDWGGMIKLKPGSNFTCSQ